MSYQTTHYFMIGATINFNQFAKSYFPVYWNEHDALTADLEDEYYKFFDQYRDSTYRDTVRKNNITIVYSGVSGNAVIGYVISRCRTEHDYEFVKYKKEDVPTLEQVSQCIKEEFGADISVDYMVYTNFV